MAIQRRTSEFQFHTYQHHKFSFHQFVSRLVARFAGVLRSWLHLAAWRNHELRSARIHGRQKVRRLAAMKQRTGIIASLCVALLASTAPSLCARAGNADESSTLLQRVQSNVEKFVDDFGLMRYQENVEQQKLRDNEKVAY